MEHNEIRLIKFGHYTPHMIAIFSGRAITARVDAINMDLM